MIKLILNFLGGSVASKLADAYKAKLNAQNDTERLEAEQNISYLEAKRDILLAEQGHWSTRWIRPFLVAPFGIYLWKLLVWDKTLGLGTTDDLSIELWQIMLIMVGAYFVGRPIEKFLNRK